MSEPLHSEKPHRLSGSHPYSINYVHAFAALGKLSLQHETLGRELLPVLAKELMTSKEDMLRNNAYLILIEMCKRYTSHADKYIPIINMCFRDRRYIVRFSEHHSSGQSFARRIHKVERYIVILLASNSH
ncbi:condensin-2 complex subunit D3 [Trichonephila clavipes]|nr:condensin-2 complex subunit D3 [Trichonephila clavipes]